METPREILRRAGERRRPAAGRIKTFVHYGHAPRKMRRMPLVFTGGAAFIRYRCGGVYCRAHDKRLDISRGGL